MKRFLTGLLAIVTSVAAIAEKPATYELTTASPGNLFVKTPATFLPTDSHAPAIKLEYQVRNWRDQVVASGQWQWSENGLTLAELPDGYYRLEYRRADQPGAAWNAGLPFSHLSPLPALPPHAYAIDAAPSWMTENDPNDPVRPTNAQQTAAAIARTIGVEMSRDRNTWAMDRDFKCDWGSNPRVTDIWGAEKVQICGMLQYAPEWMVNGDLIPVDLAAVFRFGQETAKQYGDKIPAWEFWNEPDGSSIPPWQFVAAQKAFYLGIKSVSPEVLVLNGSSCLHPVPYYMDVAFANGLSEYCDIYNFHTYEAVDALPASVADELALLRRHGVDGKPMWVTENGYSAIGTIQPHQRSRKYEHDFPTEIAQAEYAAKATMLLHTSGVERNFSFLFAPFNEGGADGLGGKVMGLLRWDFAAKAGVVALGTVIRQLGNAEYLGEWHNVPGMAGYLYRDRASGEQVLTVWMTDPTATAEFAPGVTASAVDMLGTPVADTAGKWTIDRYPVFFRGDLNLTPTQERYTPTQGAFTNAYANKHIVLSIALEEPFHAEKTKALLPETGGKARLQVYNFSPELQRGQVKVVGSAFEVSGLPEELELAPGEVVELPITIRAGEGIAGYAELAFAGAFNDGNISVLSIPVVTGGMDAEKVVEVRLPAEDPARWDENSAGKLVSVFDAAENAVRHTTTFPANADVWTYPGLLLNADESFAGAIGFSFEAKANKAIGFTLVMLIAGEADDKSAPSCWVNYKLTPEWRTTTVLFDTDLPRGVKAEEIRVVRIGANPWHESGEDATCTIWVRNFKIYYPRTDAGTRGEDN